MHVSKNAFSVARRLVKALQDRGSFTAILFQDFNSSLECCLMVQTQLYHHSDYAVILAWIVTHEASNFSIIGFYCAAV